MREAPRYFGPGRVALRLQHVRDVVEYNDVTRAGTCGQSRATQQQHLQAGLAGTLYLLRPLVARAVVKSRGNVRRKRLQLRDALVPARELEPGEAGEVRTQNRRSAVIERPQPQRFVKREHAGGKVRKYALHIGMRVGELCLVAFGGRACFGELLAHCVERLREHPELVAARDGLSLAEVTLRDGARAFDQKTERGRQALGEHEGQRQRGEEREQEGHGQREPVEPLQSLPGQQELLVLPLPGLHDFGVECQLLRHTLQELQHAHLIREADGIYRYQHAQIETLVGNGLDCAVILLLTQLAHYGGPRQIGHEAGAFGTRINHDLSALGEQRGLLRASLLA